MPIAHARTEIKCSPSVATWMNLKLHLRLRGKIPFLKKIQKCFLMPLFGYAHTNVKSDLNSAYQIFDIQISWLAPHMFLKQDCNHVIHVMFNWAYRSLQEIVNTSQSADRPHLNMCSKQLDLSNQMESSINACNGNVAFVSLPLGSLSSAAFPNNWWC